MSSSGTGPVPGPGPARRALIFCAVLVVMGAVFWAAYSGQPGSPYSPTSTAPTGAEGLALLLGQMGDRVRTAGALPPVGQGVVLVLQDDLNGPTRSLVTRWVRRGGTLVVADPSSPLAAAAPAQGPQPDSNLSASGELSPSCAAPWVQGTSTIDPDGDLLLAVPAGSTGCFSESGAAFAVASPLGSGEVVTLGGADLWTNQFLDQDDNALLAANLLAPVRGSAVAWLVAPIAAGGNQTLWGLVPLRVKVLLGALALALVVACAANARRLGRPVPEEPVVPIPASALVAATGQLLARNRLYRDAAAVLRQEAIDQFRERFGQPPGALPATVARVAAARTGTPVEEAIEVLAGPAPSDEKQLVELASRLQRLRQEVTSGTGR